MEGSSNEQDHGSETGSRLARIGRGALICLLPCLVSVFLAGTAFGARLFPWNAGMVDLGVYLRAARTLVAGGDIYHLPDSLPFIYPPIAAALAVPLTWLPQWAVQIGWALAIALVMVAVLHRVGLTGWRLSLIAAAAIRFLEPLHQTIGFGQVGVFLVGLVLLDLAPGPRALAGRSDGRRLLPVGVLVGVATAIKLTPGLFFVYLLLVRRFKDAIVAMATTAALTGLGFLVAPRLSADFWWRLLHGDSGLGGSIIYLPNQSLLGGATRVLGFTGLGNAVGLLLAAAVAVLGVIVAARWYHRGDQQLAVTLCGVATLLASPVSWSHHFVWIAPLGVLVALRTGWPAWFRILVWLFVGWVVAAPWKFLPNGKGVEADYGWWQNAFASSGAVLGCLTLVAALIVAGRLPRTTPEPGPQVEALIDSSINDQDAFDEVAAPKAVPTRPGRSPVRS